MTRKPIHSDNSNLGFKYRSALKLMTMSNGKTPKGEGAGYLSAILYLMPHTSGGGPTLCPYSTKACREMCLSGSGLSGLPKAMGAKQRRTGLYLADPEQFAKEISADIGRLCEIAAKEGMKPVVRLNGTSDIVWERQRIGAHQTIMERWPEVRFLDYTKIPLEHRRHLPANYHLTFSIEGAADMKRAWTYLRQGHSVAAVVPEDVKSFLLALDTDDEGCGFQFIDGDKNDLRFLDPPGSVVLLRPKGNVRTSLMRPHLLDELEAAR